MLRRFLGNLLWLLLLPLVGVARLLWAALLSLMGLRLQTLLTLIGLMLALSMPGPLTALLSDAGVWPLGHVLLGDLGLAAAPVVVWFGLRSRGVWRLRRLLVHG